MSSDTTVSPVAGIGVPSTAPDTGASSALEQTPTASPASTLSHAMGSVPAGSSFVAILPSISTATAKGESVLAREVPETATPRASTESGKMEKIGRWLLSEGTWSMYKTGGLPDRVSVFSEALGEVSYSNRDLACFINSLNRLDRAAAREGLAENLATRIDNGKNLLDRILGGDPPQRPTKEEISDVMLFLDAKSRVSGTEFSIGSFCIEDPDGKLYDFFNSADDKYLRSSSHLQAQQGDIISLAGGTGPNTHRGIDIPQGKHGLPSNMSTLLMSAFTPNEGERYIFLRPETHGCRINSLRGEPKNMTLDSGETVKILSRPHHRADIKSALAHLGSFLSSNFEKVCVKMKLMEVNPNQRKERTSSDVLKSYETMLEHVTAALAKNPESLAFTPIGDLVTSALKQNSPLDDDKGVRVMLENLKQASALIQSPLVTTEVQNEAMLALDRCLATIFAKTKDHSHLDVRMGDEVIFSRAELQDRTHQTASPFDLSAKGVFQSLRSEYLRRTEPDNLARLQAVFVALPYIVHDDSSVGAKDSDVMKHLAESSFVSLFFSDQSKVFAETQDPMKLIFKPSLAGSLQADYQKNPIVRESGEIVPWQDYVANMTDTALFVAKQLGAIIATEGHGRDLDNKVISVVGQVMRNFKDMGIAPGSERGIQEFSKIVNFSLATLPKSVAIELHSALRNAMAEALSYPLLLSETLTSHPDAGKFHADTHFIYQDSAKMITALITALESKLAVPSKDSLLHHVQESVQGEISSFMNEHIVASLAVLGRVPVMNDTVVFTEGNRSYISVMDALQLAKPQSLVDTGFCADCLARFTSFSVQTEEGTLQRLTNVTGILQTDATKKHVMPTNEETLHSLFRAFTVDGSTISTDSPSLFSVPTIDVELMRAVTALSHQVSTSLGVSLLSAPVGSTIAETENLHIVYDKATQSVEVSYLVEPKSLYAYGMFPEDYETAPMAVKLSLKLVDMRGDPDAKEKFKVEASIKQLEFVSSGATSATGATSTVSSTSTDSTATTSTATATATTATTATGTATVTATPVTTTAGTATAATTTATAASTVSSSTSAQVVAPIKPVLLTAGKRVGITESDGTRPTGFSPFTGTAGAIDTTTFTQPFGGNTCFTVSVLRGIFENQNLAQDLLERVSVRGEDYSIRLTYKGRDFDVLVPQRELEENHAVGDRPAVVGAIEASIVKFMSTMKVLQDMDELYSFGRISFPDIPAGLLGLEKVDFVEEFGGQEFVDGLKAALRMPNGASVYSDGGSFAHYVQISLGENDQITIGNSLVNPLVPVDSSAGSLVGGRAETSYTMSLASFIQKMASTGVIEFYRKHR